MSTTDGTVIRDCRTCRHSEYENRFVFVCEVTKAKKTRPCKCRDYDMDSDYAKANKVKLHVSEGDHVLED